MHCCRITRYTILFLFARLMFTESILNNDDKLIRLFFKVNAHGFGNVVHIIVT